MVIGRSALYKRIITARCWSKHVTSNTITAGMEAKRSQMRHKPDVAANHFAIDMLNSRDQDDSERQTADSVSTSCHRRHYTPNLQSEKNTDGWKKIRLIFGLAELSRKLKNSAKIWFNANILRLKFS